MRHPASIVCIGFLVAGCVGCGGTSNASPSSGNGPTRGASEASGGPMPTVSVRVASTSVAAGHEVSLLTIPNVGTLLARCGASNRTTTAFAVSPHGATAMVVVAAPPHSPVGASVNPGRRLTSPDASASQSWEVTPWSSAATEVVSISTSSVAHSPPGSPGCGVAAQAVITTKP